MNDQRLIVWLAAMSWLVLYGMYELLARLL